MSANHPGNRQRHLRVSMSRSVCECFLYFSPERPVNIGLSCRQESSALFRISGYSDTSLTFDFRLFLRVPSKAYHHPPDIETIGDVEIESEGGFWQELAGDFFQPEVRPTNVQALDGSEVMAVSQPG